MWMVCAFICRGLELTVQVMWRPCEVDVRCHPDVRELNAALCGAFYSEQRCGCAVPDLEWSVIGGGFLVFSSEEISAGAMSFLALTCGISRK